MLKRHEYESIALRQGASQEDLEDGYTKYQVAKLSEREDIRPDVLGMLQTEVGKPTFNSGELTANINSVLQDAGIMSGISAVEKLKIDVKGSEGDSFFGVPTSQLSIPSSLQGTEAIDEGPSFADSIYKGWVQDKGMAQAGIGLAAEAMGYQEISDTLMGWADDNFKQADKMKSADEGLAWLADLAFQQVPGMVLTLGSGAIIKAGVSALAKNGAKKIVKDAMMKELVKSSGEEVAKKALTDEVIDKVAGKTIRDVYLRRGADEAAELLVKNISGVSGGAAKGALTKDAAKKLVGSKALAEKVAPLVGATAVNYPISTGAIYREIDKTAKDQGKEVTFNDVALYGLGATMAESLPGMYFLDKIGLSRPSVITKALSSMDKRALARISKDVATGAVTEGATEVFQESMAEAAKFDIIDNWEKFEDGEKQDLLRFMMSDKAMAKYGEAFLGGAALGGLFSGIGSSVSKGGRDAFDKKTEDAKKASIEEQKEILRKEAKVKSAWDLFQNDAERTGDVSDVGEGDLIVEPTDEELTTLAADRGSDKAIEDADVLRRENILAQEKAAAKSVAKEEKAAKKQVKEDDRIRANREKTKKKYDEYQEALLDEEIAEKDRRDAEAKDTEAADKEAFDGVGERLRQFREDREFQELEKLESDRERKLSTFQRDKQALEAKQAKAREAREATRQWSEDMKERKALKREVDPDEEAILNQYEEFQEAERVGALTSREARELDLMVAEDIANDQAIREQAEVDSITKEEAAAKSGRTRKSADIASREQDFSDKRAEIRARLEAKGEVTPQQMLEQEGLSTQRGKAYATEKAVIADLKAKQKKVKNKAVKARIGGDIAVAEKRMSNILREIDPEVQRAQTQTQTQTQTEVAADPVDTAPVQEVEVEEVIETEEAIPLAMEQEAKEAGVPKQELVGKTVKEAVDTITAKKTEAATPVVETTPDVATAPVDEDVDIEEDIIDAAESVASDNKADVEKAQDVWASRSVDERADGSPDPELNFGKLTKETQLDSLKQIQEDMNNEMIRINDRPDPNDTDVELVNEYNTKNKALVATLRATGDLRTGKVRISDISAALSKSIDKISRTARDLQAEIAQEKDSPKSTSKADRSLTELSNEAPDTTPTRTELTDAEIKEKRAEAEQYEWSLKEDGTPNNQELNIDNFKAWLSKMPEALRAGVELVSSNDIDSKGKAWYGAYRNGKVYLNVDTLHDGNIMDTLFHEKLGHQLAEASLGKQQWEQTLADIKTELEGVISGKGDITLPSGKKISEILALYGGDLDVAAREVWANYIGGHAQDIFTNRSLLSRVFSGIKKMIRYVQNKGLNPIDQKASDLVDKVMMNAIDLNTGEIKYNRPDAAFQFSLALQNKDVFRFFSKGVKSAPLTNAFFPSQEGGISKFERLFRNKQHMVEKHPRLKKMFAAVARSGYEGTERASELLEMVGKYSKGTSADRRAVDKVLVEGDRKGREYSKGDGNLTETQFDMYQSVRVMFKDVADKEIADNNQMIAEVDEKINTALASKEGAFDNQTIKVLKQVKKDLQEANTALSGKGYIPRVRGNGEFDIVYKMGDESFRTRHANKGAAMNEIERLKDLGATLDLDIDERTGFPRALKSIQSQIKNENDVSQAQIESYLGMDLNDPKFPEAAKESLKLLIQAKGFSRHFLGRISTDIEAEGQTDVVRGYQETDLINVIEDYANGHAQGKAKKKAAKEISEILNSDEGRRLVVGSPEHLVANDILSEFNHKENGWDKLAKTTTNAAYNFWIAGRLSSAFWNMTHLHTYGAGFLHALDKEAGGKLGMRESIAAIGSGHGGAIAYMKARFMNKGTAVGVDNLDPQQAKETEFMNKVYAKLNGSTLSEAAITRGINGDRSPFVTMMGRKFAKATKIAGFAMHQTELSNRMGAALAHFRMYGDVEAALSFTDRLNANYSRANTPKWAESPIIKSLGIVQFQTQVQNIYELLGVMAGAKDYKALGYTFAMMTVTAGVPGLAAMKMMFSDEYEKQVPEGSFETFVNKGAFAAAGVDSSGTLGLGLPPVANLVAQFTGMNREQAAVAPVKNMMKAWNGEQPMYKAMPFKALQSVWQAVEESDQIQIGSRKIVRNGRPVSLNTGESLMTAFGFSPTSKVLLSGSVYEVGEINYALARASSSIAARIRDSVGGERRLAIQDMREFNKTLNALKKMKGYGFIRSRPLTYKRALESSAGIKELEV